MAKNRRRRRYTHPLAYVPKPVGIGFVVVVSLALVYLWMGHKCSQYSEEIKRLEDQCAELNNEQDRENTKWKAMMAPEQLDLLLVRNGMLMVYPSATQIVRVSGAARGQMPGMATALAGTEPVRGATRVAGGRAGH